MVKRLKELLVRWREQTAEYESERRFKEAIAFMNATRELEDAISGDGLPATADVVSVMDEITGHAAIYIDGTIVMEREYTLHASNVAEHTKGKLVRLTHVPVELPNDSDFPRSLEECLRYRANNGEAKT